jgi:uncharacterized protein YbjQ (UPF0145 family)
MSKCSACLASPDRARSAERQREDATPEGAKALSVKLTTAPTLEGYRITATLDIVTAECVFGMNIFRDVLAAITDVAGGRSVATQTVLRDARLVCLRELRREAALLGADAVIAVDLDYSEFSGGGKSMLFLVATGTAVKVSPAPERGAA